MVQYGAESKLCTHLPGQGMRVSCSSVVVLNSPYRQIERLLIPGRFLGASIHHSRVACRVVVTVGAENKLCTHLPGQGIDVFCAGVDVLERPQRQE